MDACENALIITERNKKWHNANILRRVFKEGELVLLYNSRLRLFPTMLKSRWTGSFRVTTVFPYGAIQPISSKGETFKANGQKLKHYRVRDPIVIISLFILGPNPLSI